MAVTIYPANAAQETGGNLASIATSEQYLSTMVDLTRQVLAELRALNIQLAGITGTPINAAISDDQSAFQ
jgi:hypothetical protein